MKCPVCDKRVNQLRIYYTEKLYIGEDDKIKMTISQIINEPDIKTDKELGLPEVQILCEDQFDGNHAIRHGDKIEFDERLKIRIDCLPMKILDDLKFPRYLRTCVQKKIDERNKQERAARERAEREFQRHYDND